MTLHTSTYKGKRILIILKDGTKIIDKFKDKKSGAVITEEYGRISTKLIQSMTICKQRPDHYNKPHRQSPIDKTP